MATGVEVDPSDTWAWAESLLDERSQLAQQQNEDTARPMMEYAQLVPEPGFGSLNFDLFPYQRAWYSQEVAAASVVVWMKSTQVGMCLRPSTKVLTADLRWVPISDVQVGDELVSVDEEHGGRPRGRKMRRAVVKAKWERERPVHELTMTDGRVLVASPEHRWLVSRGSKGRNTEWRETSRLRPGMLIRSIVRPWDEPTFEDGWFAGLLDGEGCLRQRALGAEMIVTQKEGAVMDRARAYLRSRGIPWREWTEEKPNGPVTRLYVSRSSDVLRLHGQLRPERFGLATWWEGASPPGSYGDGWAAIAEIREMPTERVVDIETSTGTFIAEGFVSHNSAYAWRWAVRQADQFGDRVLYIFPTDTHVSDFGDERIEPAIQESSYLQRRIQGKFVKNKHLKAIGRGFLYLRGSNSKAGAQSVAGQAIVFDEYDFLDQTNLPQIERRISGAKQIGKEPRIRRLGTPTIEGNGIAQAYDASDRRVWKVTCHECDHEQEITYEENLRWRNAVDGPVMRAGHDVFTDIEAVIEVWRQCARCNESIEEDIGAGRWIATNPGATVIGFHATRLIVPRTDLAQIVRASRRTKPADIETFNNNDLGRPYSAAEAQLDMTTLLQACEKGGPLLTSYTGWYPLTMGIDVAGERDLNVRIDEQLPPPAPGQQNPRRAVWIGTCDSFDAVVRLINVFRPQQVAIDGNPERRMARALQATYPPGMVVLVTYDDKTDSATLKITEMGDQGTAQEGVPRKVAVNRTDAIDAMMDGIRQGRNIPLLDPPAGWFDQMRAMKRRTVLDTKGRARRVYVTTGNAGDDYAHADVYALVATELWRLRGGVQAFSVPERIVPDEEMGFKPMNLEGDIDTYDPGFGNWGGR
jgi:hypothetical protein